MNTELELKQQIFELEQEVKELQEELERVYASKEDLLDKLEQCTQFATGLKTQRDEAIAMVNKLVDAMQKPQIILPDTVDPDGNKKLIL